MLCFETVWLLSLFLKQLGRRRKIEHVFHRMLLRAVLYDTAVRIVRDFLRKSQRKSETRRKVGRTDVGARIFCECGILCAMVRGIRCVRPSVCQDRRESVIPPVSTHHPKNQPVESSRCHHQKLQVRWIMMSLGG